MRKIFLYIIIIIISSSCSDWLDITPKGKIIPTKVADYRLLMDQIEENGSSVGVLPTYGNVLFFTDDVYIRDDIYDQYYDLSSRSIYTWDKAFYLDNEEDPDWNYLYNQIYVYNTVISEVLKSIGTEQEKKQIYGEAKIHRAFAFLILTNMYGKHYNKLTAANDLSVPLKQKPLIYGSLNRGTVAEAYTLIENDIREVINYLPETSEYRHRPYKASAYALLSRVLLYKADYANALIAANKSLEIYNYLYNYNDLGIHSYFGNIDFPKNYLNKEVILNKQPTNPYSLIYPSDNLKSVYDEDADLRWKGYLMEEWFPPYTNLVYIVEYTVGRQLGLTVPEVLLNKAECEARVGDYNRAITILNIIREKRFESGKYKALVATNAIEALKLVKDERRRELAFHGLRLFDLKRYNTHDNANISLTRTLNGATITLSHDSPRWVFPIANKYILKNPEIVQNQR